ncbi:glycoside hydrolase family protein [Burkholderia pseudomallei]|uniref:glycosyltransferase n=1 Tax=Burkholderia pseudomallei TaxID=28450 RepID=UPI000F05FC63|nr:glycosyltransferase [Burkholderia pseudomallei]MCW0138736.1 glycosyltransferase [Burkholderia pseudomallei]CAJ2792782.1 glycoside hydrolase family protein [Burkholderia pseudomallei]CAJ2924469.1 glycoside hydrolase family protein [Burkholderia pseudomallei]CAJ3392177.1 glycoside hydrolase family protein [Burkholderia pseudomallei]CAJ3513589.1 glycoside hydrolase family protein [Burkholderia pseudomallei]
MTIDIAGGRHRDALPKRDAGAGARARMKIVQVLESSATGTLSMVCLIANRLAREGHDVHVVYSLRPDTPANFHALFDATVKLRHIQMKGVPLLPMLLELRRTLVGIGPDVVHLHSSFAGFLGRIGTLFALREAAFFYSPHCISFMRRDISAFKRAAFVALERIACAKRCLYVACSDSERDAVRVHLRQPVVVVENAVGAMPAPAAAESDSAHETVLRIVTVGGIRVQKNPRLFAEIARRLCGSRVRFAWIGDGDAALKAELRDAGVEVAGWLGRGEVLARLRRTDVYLSTSSWEGMPVSVIEAMLLGLPVVASACAGNVDVVRHLQTGAIFRGADDAVELLASLERDAALRARLAHAARQEARERFGEARFFRQLARVYASRPARVS